MSWQQWVLDKTSPPNYMSRYKHYSESLDIVARMQFVDVVVAACYRPQKLGGICVALVELKLQQSNGQSFWKQTLDQQIVWLLLGYLQTEVAEAKITKRKMMLLVMTS